MARDPLDVLVDDPDETPGIRVTLADDGAQLLQLDLREDDYSATWETGTDLNGFTAAADRHLTERTPVDARHPDDDAYDAGTFDQRYGTLSRQDGFPGDYTAFGAAISEPADTGTEQPDAFYTLGWQDGGDTHRVTVTGSRDRASDLVDLYRQAGPAVAPGIADAAADRATTYLQQADIDADDPL